MSVGVQCERVCLCKHCEGRGSRVEELMCSSLYMLPYGFLWHLILQDACN